MSLKIFQNTIQGRVAIGEKVTRQNSAGKTVTFPAKLDYFVFTKPFDPKTGVAPKFPAMTKVMTEKYKTDKPKEIEVTFVDHHPDEVFFTNYMNYAGKICNCYGNGEIATRTDAQGNKKEVKCDYERCEFRQKKTDKGVENTCKPTGILTFLIPEAPVSGGVWKFVTHSIMTIGKISGALRNIASYRKTLYYLRANLKISIVSMLVKGTQQNIPTVEVELPFSMPEIEAGASTALGTLEEIKKQFNIIDKVLPSPKRMQELASSSGEIGSDESNESPVIDATIVEAIQLEPSDKLNEQDGEFNF